MLHRVFVVRASALSLLAALNGPAAQDGSIWRAEGDQAGARFGSALATADVNGDGFGDLVVGAPLYDDQFHDEGRVSVYLGSASGLATTPAWVRHGRQTGAHLGAVVVNLGDVNGDGIDDIAFSAPEYDVRLNKWNPYPFGSIGVSGRYAPNEGRVVVYLGSASGLGLLPNRILDGLEFREHFGTALAGVGDVNGDGYDDLLAGSPGKASGLGGALLFSGSASGVSSVPSWIGLAGTSGSGYGREVARAGDTNGDGFADFEIGRPGFETCFRVVLHLGSASGLGAEVPLAESLVEFGPAVDLNQDGLPELLYSVEGCGTTGLSWRRHGLGSVGTYPISGAPASVVAGDLDGDGFQDVVAGLPTGTAQGRVSGYFGAAGQLTPLAAFLTLDGQQPGDDFGRVLAVADVDGQSGEELFVAAPLHDAGQADEGLVRMYSSARRLAISVTPRDLELDYFVVGDFNSDGFSDWVQGDAGLLSVRYGSPTGLQALAQGLVRAPIDGSFNVVSFVFSTGDVNGDGFEDLLASAYAELGGPHGGFTLISQPHALYLGAAAGLSANPYWVLSDTVRSEARILGDVNADGFDDLVLAHPVHGDQLLLGTPAGPVFYQGLPPANDLVGSWGTDPLTLVSSRNQAMLAGDVDGDGFSDVVFLRQPTSANRHQIELHRGSANGLVFVQRYIPGAEGLSTRREMLAFEDLDGDGFDDVVLGSNHLLAGSSSGLRHVPTWWEQAEESARAPILALSNLDQDGRTDVMFSSAIGSGVITHAGYHVHLGASFGLAGTTVQQGLARYSPILLHRQADFDGDGLFEVVLRRNELPGGAVLLEFSQP